MSSRLRVMVPVTLAALCVLVFGWVLFGVVLGGPEEEPRVSNQATATQAQQDEGEPLAPEVESRAVDSYAAYESKDPFRQLLAPAEEQVDDVGADPREPRGRAGREDLRDPAARGETGDRTRDRTRDRAQDRPAVERPDREERIRERRSGRNDLFESGGIPD